MISGAPLEQLRAAPGSERAAAVLAKPFSIVEVISVIQGLLQNATAPSS